MRNLFVKTQPAIEPVTADEVKLHSRIDVNDDDTLITLMAAAARQASELYTGRAYITQTLVLTCPCNTAGEIWLPRPPFTSVTGVKVLADDLTWTALTVTTDYKVVTIGDRGLVVIQSPDTTSTYEITFTAGYGAAASSVPAALRQAVLQRAAALYEHRGDGLEAGLKDVPETAKQLENQYRILTVGAGA